MYKYLGYLFQNLVRIGYFFFQFLDIYLGFDSISINFKISNTVKQSPFDIYVLLDSVQIYFIQFNSIWLRFMSLVFHLFFTKTNGRPPSREVKSVDTNKLIS